MTAAAAKAGTTVEGASDPTEDAAWTLTVDGYDTLRESSLASRFSISNGFLGIRGGRVISSAGRCIVPPRTYVAGLFDTPNMAGSVPGLVPAANWLRFQVSTAGGPFTHDAEDAAGHRVILDMKRGVLLSECRGRSGPGLVARLRTLRLVSLSERAVGLQLIRLEVEQGDSEVTIDASFEDAAPSLVAERLDQELGVWRTGASGKALAMASAASLTLDGEDLPPTAREALNWRWTWRARPGQVVEFTRLLAVTRHETRDPETGAEARETLSRGVGRGWRALTADHEAAWQDRWLSSDVEIEGDPAAQQAVRFAAYHLNSAANPGDDRVSIGARALTGDDYLGHVFWDTEIFMLPFYTFTWPEAARALLTYRFHTLGAARAKARQMGWQGALYAWESADTGTEATPRQLIGPDRKVVDILTGGQEQHISADVAYAVWQYWQATGDEAFLLDAGAEILLETGRFWASRAQLEADGRHHIRHVIGPDEYHEDIDDNAFTNVMARWNICRALEVAALLSAQWPQRWAVLSKAIALDDAELTRWRAVADAMATGLDASTGLYEQFEGYFAFEQVDLAAYAGRSVPMDVVLGRERTSRSQVVKQADVVALLALLPDSFAAQSGADNFNFYAPRCGQGSSLSPTLHGLAAARLGEPEVALRYFRQTAAIDLADTHAAIGGGVHIGAQGGLWQLTVFGFAGLSIQGETLAIDPRLPPGWDSLRFRIHWRGRKIRFAVVGRGDRLEIALEAGSPLTVLVNGHPHTISRDGALDVTFAPGRGRIAAGLAPNLDPAASPRILEGLSK